MDIGIICGFFATWLILLAAAAYICSLVRSHGEALHGDQSAQSAMQQRRYDDLVGLCERIESMLEKPKPVTSGKPYDVTPAKPKAQVMDYETSQIAALDEFKDEK